MRGPVDRSAAAVARALQMSSASGQRGWNAHPDGGKSIDGGDPTIGFNRSPGPASAGNDASRPPVYGCRDRWKMSSTERDLGHPSRVHHLHAVGDPRDHAEVVRDEHDRGVRALLDRLQQLEDLRLDRHVERGRRLVGDEHVGIVRDHHRDHRPLAHAARELVRVLPHAHFRARDADQVEQLDRAISRLVLARGRERCARIASVICLPTRCTGFSAVSGSWKIIAMLGAADVLQLLRLAPDQLLAPELRRARDLGRARQAARASRAS